ncbi:DUF4870 domain-containing protein [Fulvivirgaceae bacterium BMA10]|uniref:DUF4870 domain-containing protein n=1 Tax=Splendidivirga corallicola TaxID=3051826 RepID=A0ABT8KUP0_9BACT|nr:DUF4870 domain-containing protein [Fulvivirgaceae bacterium BMA10]
MDKNFVCEKIVYFRKLKGMTQEELAEKSNLNVRTVQRIESGEVDPRLYTLKVIAEALEVSMDAFTPPPPEKDRGSLAMLHLSTLAYFILPFCGNVIGPFIFWVYKRDHINLVNQQGKDLINAQISYSIYLFLTVILVVLGMFATTVNGVANPYMIVGPAIFFGLFIFLFLVVLPISKAWRIYKGKGIRSYPLKFTFIK